MKRKFSRIIALACVLVLLVVTSAIGAFAATGSDTGTDAQAAASFEELKALNAPGNVIKLTADVTVSAADALTLDDITLDLDGNTLTLLATAAQSEKCIYTEQGDLTIKNGNIVVASEENSLIDTGYFNVGGGTTLTLENVTLTGKNYRSNYLVDVGFRGETGATLKVVDSTVNLDTNTWVVDGVVNGSVFYSGSLDNDIVIENSTFDCKNVGDFAIYGSYDVTDSAITVTGTTQDGVSGIDHGFNGSDIVLNDSDLSISGGSGRGITLGRSASSSLTVNGTSTVSVTDMGEATIKLSNATDTLTVAETAKVYVDAEITNDVGVTVEEGAVSIATLAGAGTATNPWIIADLEDLAWFRDDVDAGNQYYGEYVKVTAAEIDLAGIEWEPIGSHTEDKRAFQGSFDGNGVVIKNLCIEKAGTGIGFFAATSHFNETLAPTVLKNITFENPIVKSTDNSNYVGTLVANSRGWTTIENVSVVGTVDISGRGYVGGIVGHGYAKISDCSLEASGSIKSSFWCCGGIIGYAGEGGTVVSGCSVAAGEEGLLIESAAGGVAGVVGMAAGAATASDLTVSGITVATTGEGYPSYTEYCIGYAIGSGEQTATDNIVVENVTFDAAGNTSPAITDAVATVDGVICFSLADAFAAAQGGETITLLRDITVTEKITVTNQAVLSDITLDGNGHTISANMPNDTVLWFGDASQSKWCTGVKIRNLTIDGPAKYAIYLTGGTFTEMTNVTVTGTYHEVYGAVIFYGTNGGTLTNCDIVSGFSNGQANYPLTLVNTKVGSLLVNDSEAGGAKVFVDEESSITKVVCGGTDTGMIDPASVARIETVVLANGDSWTDTVSAVAEINGVYYATLADAVAAAQAGDTIELLCDVTLGAGENILITEGMDVTVSGNDHTITAEDGFYVTGGKLTLNDDLSVVVSVYNAIYVRGGDVVTSANLKVSGKYAAIQGNGSYSGNVTINGGVIESATVGIYWPQDGKLTINGGEITGTTAVYLKSGSLEITGGTLNGVGAAQDYAFNGSGAVSTGEALAIENVDANGYEAISSVVITGGTFTTANAASPIGSYAATSVNESAVEVAKFIAGPVVLNKAIAAELCADGYKVAEGEDGSYSVSEIVVKSYEVGEGKTYATMNDAIAAAVADGADVVTYLVYGKTTLETGFSHGVVNFGGTTVTVEGMDDAATMTVIGGGVPNIANVTFKNITLEDEGTYLTTANEFMYQNYDDCTFIGVTFNDGVRLSGVSVITDCIVNADTANEYAIWLDAGELTITGTSVTAGNDAYGMIKSDLADSITATDNTFVYEGVANKEVFNTDGATIVATGNTFVDCTEGIVPADKTNDVNGGAGITSENNTIIITPSLDDGYASESEDGSKIYMEIKNFNGSADVVICLYSGETLIAKTVLVKEYSVSTLGVTFEITDPSSSWDTEWLVAPVCNLVPDRAVLVIDGKECDDAAVYMHKPDFPDEVVVWALLDGVQTAASITTEDGTTYYATLADAIAAAQDGDEVVILTAGTYTLPSFTKDITITAGAEGVVIDVASAVALSGADVVFNGITFDYYPNKNYVGLQHVSTVVYNDCTFLGQVFLYGSSEIFNDCVFEQNSSDAYNVWTYGAKYVEFNRCEFTCAGKSVLVYNEGSAHATKLEVTETTFVATETVEGKAAIEIDTSLMAGADIVVDDKTTVNDTFGTGSVSGNTLYNNKKGQTSNANNDITVTVGGETVLAPVSEIVSAQVAIGESLSMYFNVMVNPEHVGDGTLAMIFERNGVTYTVTATVANGGHVAFVFENIAPQTMADAINASLVVLNSDGEVEKTLAVIEGYSVKANLDHLATLTAEELGYGEAKYAAYKALIADLLVYGGAAQEYTDHNTDNLVSEGVEGTEWVDLEGSDAVIGEVNGEAYFTAAGIRFDTVNKMYFKFYAEDVASVTVTIGGVTYTADDFVSVGDNLYVVYSESIKAYDLYDALVTATISVGGVESQTISYSVSAYAYAKQNSANAKTQALAKALYSYARSAYAFANAD